MRRYIFFLFLVVLTGQARAQSFLAYLDSAHSLYTFDDGYIRRMEQRPVYEFKGGLNRVAYVLPYDNLFKISIGTGSQVIYNGIPDRYEFSRSMLVYITSNNQYLNCFWNGRPRKLEPFFQSYAFSDSTVAYVDRFINFKCFFDGYVKELENRIPVSYKVAENLVAWQNPNGYFRVFWNDSIYTPESYDVKDYRPSMNTVSYIDNVGIFKVFYKGNVVKLEELSPQRYYPGDDMLAWINQQNELWVFHKADTQKLEQYIPDVVGVQDKLMYYGQNNQYFKVYDKGMLITVEEYVPADITVFDKRLYYLDRYKHLKLYEGGFSSDISKEQVVDYWVNGDVVAYNTMSNEFVILYKGKKTRLMMNARPFPR